MLIAVAACVPAVAVLAAALLLGRRQGASAELAEAVAVPRQLPPPRPEDRVRPIVGASGEKLWADADELSWHEIVAWSAPTYGDARAVPAARAVG